MGNKIIPEKTEISGERKDDYLKRLDSALTAITSNLQLGMSGSHLERLNEFASQNSWEMHRLPRFQDTYQRLATLNDRVRQEYDWLQWHDDKPNPINNFGYFEEIGISSRSGLPWVWDFVALSRLKKDVDEELARIGSHEGLLRDFRRLLIEDYVDCEEVPSNAQRIHSQAMKRRFLEKLKESEIIGWKNRGRDPVFSIDKTADLGGEKLWNISCINYSRAESMFYLLVIDLWQDILNPPEIREDNDKVEVSDQLRNRLSGFSGNEAWYVIKAIDDAFPSLHPVHVSKARVGPFENRYLLRPSQTPLPGLIELLKMNPDEGFLRFSRQYSYAPNHEVVGNNQRQILYRTDWSDEIITCPPSFSAQLSDSVLGTDIRIIEV